MKEIIEFLENKRAWSQAMLADELKVSRSTVHNYVQGKRVPSRAMRAYILATLSRLNS